MDLTGKSVLVTGASRGIGRAIAVALARAGADVAINYAGNEEAAKKTEDICAAYGVKTLVIRADVSDAEACKAMVEQVKTGESVRNAVICFVEQIVTHGA